MKDNKYSRRYIIGSLVLLSVFIIDIFIPLGAAVGVLYVCSIVLLIYEKEKIILFFSILTTFFILLVLILTATRDTTWMVYVNRSFSIIAIWVLYYVSVKHKQLSERNKIYIHQLEQKNKELERSEFLLNETGSLAKVGGWDLDLKTMTTYFSEETFRIYEIPMGTPPAVEDGIKFYAPEAQEFVQKTVAEAIENHKEYNIEVPFITGKGRRIWVRTIGRVEVINDKAVRLNGAMQDITDRKKAEEELMKSKDLLEKSKQQLETITNNLPGAVIQYKINPDGTDAMIFVSEGSIQIWGIKPELAMQNNQLIWQQIDEECIDGVKKSIELSYKSLSPWNVEFKNNLPNGSVKWIQGIGTPQKMKDGSVVWDSIMLDITKKKQAETKIEEYQQSLQNLTTEISLVEEKQRKEIAENIHDHLSQSLVISKMKLADLKKENISELNKAEIQSVLNHISTALENSRKITYDLSPPILYELGLIETMYWLVEKIEEENKLKATFVTELTDVDLPEQKLILIYRIIQELVNNIVKHAKASKIDITFGSKREGIEITVIDNGEGFDVNKLAKVSMEQGGFGLFAVKERVRNLGGTFAIDTKKGEGTNVKFYIPLKSI